MQSEPAFGLCLPSPNTMNTKLRLVGDLHGDHDAINKVLQSCHRYDLTIQLGDYGAGFGAEAYLPLISPDTFKVLHGNHDNPDVLERFSHNLGRFGTFEFAGKLIFFVAGAYSIDVAYRTPGLSWWAREELSYEEGLSCLTLWESVCKDVDLVLSHDIPHEVCIMINRSEPVSTSTAQLLSQMAKIHSPPLWRFGHWHKTWRNTVNGTEYRCLNINEQEVIEW